MKKVISKIAIFAILLMLSIMIINYKSAFAIEVVANETTGSHFTISDTPDEDGSYTCTGYTPGTSEETEITLPRIAETDKKINKIGDECFADMGSLKKITIESEKGESDGIPFTIGNSAFTRCVEVESIILPNDLKTLGDYVFKGCMKLESLDLSNTDITTFTYYSLDNMSALKSIILPKGYSGDYETLDFYCCPNLKEISISADNPNYTVEEGVLYNKDKTILVKYPPMRSGKKFEVPATVTKIAYNAFNGTRELEEIILPSSVTEIEGYAFKDGTKLVKVVIPESVTTIGQYITANIVNRPSTTTYIYCKSTAKISEYVEAPDMIVIDDAAPVISSFIQDGNIITVTATDGEKGAGLATKAYSFDGKVTWTENPAKTITEAGTYTVYVRDALGNIGSKDLVVEKIDFIPEIKDETIAKEKFPQTGISCVVAVLIGISLVVCVVVGRKFKKYNF